MVGILALIFTLIFLHFYHSAIRKKIARIREILDELASVEQNEAYGLVLRSQRRSSLHTSPLYETIPDTVSQSIKHTLCESDSTDAEYDYIDEHNRSFAVVSNSHRRGAVRNLRESDPLYVNVEVTVHSHNSY